MNERSNNKIPDDVIKAIYNGNSKHIINWVNGNNINNLDSDRRSIVFHAVISGIVDILAIVLSNNAQINIKDQKGWFPIHYAVQNYSIDITTLLITHGAMIDVTDNFGNTPLWRAVFASQGKGELIKLLLSNGAAPEKQNDSGISPLSLAEKIANYDLVQFFEQS
jgi:ankyrin repeat protein